MNYKRMGGNVLEDEKRLGTCYFSISNTALGGSLLSGFLLGFEINQCVAK